MLLNISYNDPEVKRRIEKAVGKPFSLQKRWQLGGIGSPKLFMNSFSIDIHNLLILDQPHWAITYKKKKKCHRM